MNFQMLRLDLEKAEEPEIKLPTSIGSSKKQKLSKKIIYFCFIDYAKDSDCVDHNKLWKILKEMGTPDHLTCLLRNLCAGQEATDGIRHGTTALTYSFPNLELVCCSMSSSNCCFLSCIQISQEEGKVVWCSHLHKNFPQFVVIHTVKGFGIVNKAELDVFSGALLLFR